MNKKIFGLLIALLAVSFVFVAGHGECRKDGYKYITVQEFKARLDAGDHEKGLMAVMTSQTEKEYASGHLKCAFPTYARPLTSDADFAKLDPFLEKVKNTQEDIIIICPRGHSGAERPYDYFKKHGIAEERLFILEDGQEAFNKAHPDDVSR